MGYNGLKFYKCPLADKFDKETKCFACQMANGVENVCTILTNVASVEIKRVCAFYKSIKQATRDSLLYPYNEAFVEAQRDKERKAKELAEKLKMLNQLETEMGEEITTIPQIEKEVAKYEGIEGDSQLNDVGELQGEIPSGIPSVEDSTTQA